MKKFISIFILLNINALLFAQNITKSIRSRPLNSAYLTFLGDASSISINYERQFVVDSTFIITSKLGLGLNEESQWCFYGPCSLLEEYRTIPHHITLNLGKGRRFVELGLGGTVMRGKTTQPYFLYPIIGYRLMALKSHQRTFRAFLQVPFSGLKTDDILFIPFGLSVGRSF